VFPCFIFIMGVSIAFSFKSIAKSTTTQTRTSVLLFKIIKRSILLFFFGLVVSNTADSLEKLRISGVLQRFSLSYFVCSIIELWHFKARSFTYSELSIIIDENNSNLNAPMSKLKKIESMFQEIFSYLWEWLIIIIFTLIWLIITFCLSFENCEAGYLGPGKLNAYFRA
jgi:heparan-alpha-glucosaminide N-acetyltransferase